MFSLLCACASLQDNDKEVRDSGPDRPLSVSHIPEPVPRYEPRTRAGNTSPYVVLGKRYTLLNEPQGYSEQGRASWYGNKFHGQRTANGELYDMYGMTAAHKTLPIPSYVRVTNLDNNRSVIVRVNDRGPFHDGRIIDLSYTAARKLGMAELGTAPVRVDYIHVERNGKVQEGERRGESGVLAEHDDNDLAPAPAPDDVAGYRLPDNTFLQVGAFSNEQAATALQRKVASMTTHPVKVRHSRSANRGAMLYRVQVGPFISNLELMDLRQSLSEAKIAESHVVYQ